MHAILSTVMQRDVVILVLGLLLAHPASALSRWLWSRLSPPQGASAARSTTPARSDQEPSSWLTDAVGFVAMGVVVGVPLVAITPLLVVIVAGFIYVCWRLAWLLLQAIWEARPGDEARVSADKVGGS